jgi:hypothetical protein
MGKYAFDFGDISPNNYYFSISLVLALLFAFIDDSDNLSFWVNLLRWLLQSVLPMALMILSYKTLGKMERFNNLNAWVKLFISGLTGALLFTPFALCLDFFLGIEPAPQNTNMLFVALYDEIRGAGPPIVLCWLAINTPWIYGFKVVKQNKKVIHDHSDTILHQQQNSMQQLMDLLPPDKRGAILYLKSELHYLMVTTTVGQSLILMNLKDAISLCAASGGIQPHRSFWVSESAIKDFRKTGREGVLILTDNTEIPVSRNKLTEVKNLFG